MLDGAFTKNGKLILPKVIVRKSEITDGGDSGDDFSKLELVQDGCLTSSIKTYHQNPHFLLREQPAEQLSERQPHPPSLQFAVPNHATICDIADPSPTHILESDTEIAIIIIN